MQPSLDDLQLQRLCDRLRVAAPTVADHATLDALQLAFLRTVPFENLDIARGVPIELDDDDVFDKVVHQHRGGYCYELNSLFARLLSASGFSVDLVSARVHGDSGPGPEYDHLALIVTAPEPGALPRLVDVGFGDAFVRPIPLDGITRRDGRKDVRVERAGDRWRYVEAVDDEGRVGYDFSPTPRLIADFASRHLWQQTAADSHFTAGSICTLLRPDGSRVTLSGPGLGDRLITTSSSGERVERRVRPASVRAVLAETFDIHLEP